MTILPFERKFVSGVPVRVARAALVAAFAIIAFVRPNLSCASTPDQKPIIEVLNTALDAGVAGDFNRFVSLVHPRTQQLFRNVLSARTDVLLRSYSQEQISAVSGLPAHPKDLSLSDSEFFVFACYNTRTRHPDFADFSRYFPFTLEGTTLEKDQLLHVVLSYPGSTHTERTDYNFIRAFPVTFRQDRSRWLMWSCPFAETIGDLWCRDLTRDSSPAVVR